MYVIAVMLLVQYNLAAGLQGIQPSYLKHFRINHFNLRHKPEARVEPISTLTEQAGLPDFCNGLDCPAFSLVNKTEDYEERRYVASRWVSTHLEGVDYDAATRTMFMRLFDYIEGENAKKQKIAMTAPVLTSVIPGPGPACKSNFTMSFFMSPSVADPPKPTDSTVFLSSLPEQTAFVRSFGGFAKESVWLKNAEALAKALSRDSQSFNQGYFYTAGYDSPFKILNRHNEIWYIAQ